MGTNTYHYAKDGRQINEHDSVLVRGEETAEVIWDATNERWLLSFNDRKDPLNHYGKNDLELLRKDPLYE